MPYPKPLWVLALTLPLFACSEGGGGDGASGGGGGGGGGNTCAFTATGDVALTTTECGATANFGMNTWTISIVADDDAKGMKGFISQWPFQQLPAPGTYDANDFFDPNGTLPLASAALTTTDGTVYSAGKPTADGGLELSALLELESLQDAAPQVKLAHGKLTASLTETSFMPDAGPLGSVQVTVDF